MAAVCLARQYSRVERADSVLVPHLFADFYRFESPARPVSSGVRPLIVYWGGALLPGEYEARRQTVPDRIVAVVEDALPSEPPSFDLLVFSSPPVTPRTRRDLRRDLRRAFTDEILRQTPNPRPSAIGYVGYSSGASVVLSLAFEVPGSCAAAMLAGVDLTDLLLDTTRPSVERLRVLVCSNVDDPLASHSRAFRNALEARGLSLAFRTGRGGHDWDEYSANGSVRRAFVWVLAALLD